MKNTVKVLCIAAFCALLSGNVLADKVRDAVSISEYRVNGSRMIIGQYETVMKAGDFIGEKIFEYKQAGFAVSDGEDARLMAKMFVGNMPDYDCVYVEDEGENGKLFIARPKTKGGAFIEEVQMPPYCESCGTKQWRSDGIKIFPGSRWNMSIELKYKDGTSSFSNFYLTGRTDMAAVKAHYSNYFSKNAWKIMSQWSAKGEYVYIIIKGKELLVVMLYRLKNGTYNICITG